MPKPTLADFQDLVLEVEWVPDSGTYSKFCAMEQVTINRNKQVDQPEVPADCDDESLPYVTRANTRARSFSISGTGYWNAQSHGLAMDWFNGTPDEKLRVRITHAKAEVGTPEYETGLGVLSVLNNDKRKGQQVSAEITITIDGDLVTTDKAA
jgi:hypothetical protein